MNNWAIYGFIALGGAGGACLRFFVAQITLQLFGKGFPFGTLLVNVVGSCLLGLLVGLLQHGHLEIAPWRSLVGVGFLGAFTTFSTFSVDTLLLLQHGDWLKASLNVLLNLGCCVGGAAMGFYLVKG